LEALPEALDTRFYGNSPSAKMLANKVVLDSFST
jgi:hypothetical protein